MPSGNLQAAWVGFLAGCISGAVPGLFFHREAWLGGYDSWPRRMIRLGHIAFFGIGLLNLGFALTIQSINIQSGTASSSALLLIGVVTMPAVCYLSAWRKPFRHFFFIPALSITAGVGNLLWRLLLL